MANSPTILPREECGPTDLTRLQMELRAVAARIDQLEQEVVDLRHNQPSGIRHRLFWLLGVHLYRLWQYEPRPLRVPDWYQRQAPPTEPPLISIVTPTFNQASFLERTMNSILDQHYPHLEYTVQDGGSTDSSTGILKRHRSRLKHAESRPDRGQAHAINLGFQRSNGEIMAYLNSDDILLPGALNYVAAFFKAHPHVDVVYSHRVIVDGADQEIGRWVLPPHSNEMLSWVDFVPQETLFWRRRIWDRIGGAMDESFQFALDWDLLLRFRAARANFVRLPRFLGAFRWHSSQKTQTQRHVGQTELGRLMQRTHGRDISNRMSQRRLRGYLVRHAFVNWLYRLGVARY